jgi:hypothetical protein
MAERRRREDEAPRLRAEVPRLEKLDLQISDSKGATGEPTTHVKRVVVAQAPAWFEIPCTDPACKDGGHELSHDILSALRAKRTSFAGEDVCQGSVGSAQCGRLLRYTATAAFGA